MRDTTVEQFAEITEGDLFSLYCEYIDATRSEIALRTAPGSYRERLLKLYRPLPREHFEARLDALRGNPAEYEVAVASLRRGFVPRRNAVDE